MPVPCFNVINGGEHAGNKLAFQEFFVIPTGAASFGEGMEIGCEVFHNLKSVIKAKFGGDATLIGDEGGFAPPCTVESGLEMLMEAVDKAGYLDKCSVGLDVAASEFKVEGKNQYDLDFKTASDDPSKNADLLLSGDELMQLYQVGWLVVSLFDEEETIKRTHATHTLRRTDRWSHLMLLLLMLLLLLLGRQKNHP